MSTLIDHHHLFKHRRPVESPKPADHPMAAASRRSSIPSPALRLPATPGPGPVERTAAMGTTGSGRFRL